MPAKVCSAIVMMNIGNKCYQNLKIFLMNRKYSNFCFLMKLKGLSNLFVIDKEEKKKKNRRKGRRKRIRKLKKRERRRREMT